MALVNKLYDEPRTQEMLALLETFCGGAAQESIMFRLIKAKFIELIKYYDLTKIVDAKFTKRGVHYRMYKTADGLIGFDEHDAEMPLVQIWERHVYTPIKADADPEFNSDITSVEMKTRKYRHIGFTGTPVRRCAVYEEVVE